jgi:hypothetical protein
MEYTNRVEIHVDINNPRINQYAAWLRENIPATAYSIDWENYGQHGTYVIMFAVLSDLVAFKLKFGI